jgi:hypothetical protein
MGNVVSGIVQRCFEFGGFDGTKGSATTTEAAHQNARRTVNYTIKTELFNAQQLLRIKKFHLAVKKSPIGAQQCV